MPSAIIQHCQRVCLCYLPLFLLVPFLLVSLMSLLFQYALEGHDELMLRDTPPPNQLRNEPLFLQLSPSNSPSGTPSRHRHCSDSLDALTVNGTFLLNVKKRHKTLAHHLCDAKRLPPGSLDDMANVHIFLSLIIHHLTDAFHRHKISDPC